MVVAIAYIYQSNIFLKIKSLVLLYWLIYRHTHFWTSQYSWESFKTNFSVIKTTTTHVTHFVRKTESSNQFHVHMHGNNFRLMRLTTKQQVITWLKKVSWKHANRYQSYHIKQDLTILFTSTFIPLTLMHSDAMTPINQLRVFHCPGI